MSRLDEIRRAGADLVLIGNGRSDQATAFAHEVPGVTVLTDPSLRTYRALELRRGVLATLSPRSAIAAASAFRSGHRQTATAGDPWQQGGLAVVAPGGRILFVQQNSDAGERPDVDGALRALASNPSRGR